MVKVGLKLPESPKTRYKRVRVSKCVRQVQRTICILTDNGIVIAVCDIRHSYLFATSENTEVRRERRWTILVSA